MPNSTQLADKVFGQKATDIAVKMSIERNERESMVFCPDCRDSLQTTRIWRPDKDYGKVIDHYEYYCFGCDKTFILREKKK
jgi:predicted RNA-binding Zn-ribbon protein involved in translation (DUF1610 family)